MWSLVLVMLMNVCLLYLSEALEVEGSQSGLLLECEVQCFESVGEFRSDHSIVVKYLLVCWYLCFCP